MVWHAVISRAYPTLPLRYREQGMIGTVLSTHVLDSPVWASLTGPHADLAETVGRARRYPTDVTSFVGLADHADPGAWDDLRSLVGPQAVVGMTASSLRPPDDWTVMMSGEGVQLVATDEMVSRPYDQAVVLGEEDVEDMLALVALTQPGPFRPRTHTLGTYLGLRDDGRLVAMAGERLHPPGYTEISAVCTHPDYRGRGYATALVRAVAHGIRQRGEVPMMHAAASNTNAIRLYEAMGFALRKRTTFMAVRATGLT